jgi:hypothetical protein
MFDWREIGNLGIHRAKISDGQVMNTGVARKPREILQLFCDDAQKVFKTSGGLVDFQVDSERRILSSNSHGAFAGVANLYCGPPIHRRMRPASYQWFCSF